MRRIVYRTISYTALILYFIHEKLRKSKKDNSRISKWYVSYNNNFYIKKLKNKKLDNKKIMILLPHCLQDDECNIKITSKASNCKRCGKCDIGSIVKLCEEKNIFLKVVNGGTLARKSILDNMPTVVIAVACERDLVTGIFDAFPMPVIGIFNVRENGPCYNTGVNISELEKIIFKLTDREEQ